MRIGVVQHRLRATVAEDVRALADAVRAAGEQGAELVVIPCVPGLASDAVRDGVVAEVRELGLRCGVFGPTCYSPGSWGVVDTLCGVDITGPVVALCGDSCFDESIWREALKNRPGIAVFSPLAESDLQAEAAFEVALGLSDALCGLVIVSECAGAEAGEPGHGGSAIIMLGDVVCEALGEEDILIADIDLPVSPPEPPAPFPQVPTILMQRLALHSGRKPDVDYLADLSSGPGAR